MKKRILSFFMCFLFIFTGVFMVSAEDRLIFLRDFTFKDSQTGTILGDTIPASVSISGYTDNSSSSFKATFIAAIYDGDDMLIGYNEKEVSIVGGATPISIDVSKTGNKTGRKIVCFVWDKSKLMTPVSTTVEFSDGVIDYDRINTVFYVSPTGSVNGSGTEDNPFDSIVTAKNYINTIKHKTNEDIVVNIKPGVYTLSEPIEFTEADSGVNGSTIIYRGLDATDTIISGGKKLTGWNDEGSGVWSISLPNESYVSELYVNNRAAQRAHNEEAVFYTGTYGTNGLVINYDSKIASIKANDNAEVSIVGDWRDVRTKISSVKKHPISSNKLVIYFAEGANGRDAFTGNVGASSGYGFHIENGRGLMDNVNEFYFDKDTKKLYYIPIGDKNPDTLDVYLPKLDRLLRLKGTDSLHKVENIKFENLSFMHTTWKRMENETYHAYQGVIFWPQSSTNIEDYYPQIGMAPAAVQFDHVNNVTFSDNIVACTGAVGVGMYNGVSNSNITGNIVTQTAHSGMSLGMSSHQVTEGGHDVAYRKPVTASSERFIFPAAALTDGDCDFAWESDLNDPNAWAQVDLGKPYKITGIGINFRGARVEVSHYENGNPVYSLLESKDFCIQASNDPTFKTYETIVNWITNDQGVNDIVKRYETSPSQNYRYVRYQRQGSGAFGDLMVYTYEPGYGNTKDGCEYVTISDNYIADVGTKYYDSLGIHMIYGRNCSITNNTIRETPYSAISVGWGWERQRQSQYCKDNSIEKNRIERAQISARDGAAIYVVGSLPGLRVRGNYIKDTRNSFGGIYPDNGTVGYNYVTGRTSNIRISDNVIEGGPMWFHGWHPTEKYITVTNNYTTVSHYRNDMDPSTTSLSNTNLYVESNPPAKVKSYIAGAGVSADRMQKAHEIMASFFGYDTGYVKLEEAEESADVSNLIASFTLRQPGTPGKTSTYIDTDNAWWYYNNGSRINTTRLNVAEQLTHILRIYGYYAVLLEDNPSWLAGYEEEWNELKSTISYVKEQYNGNSSTTNQYNIMVARETGEKALEKFAYCGIFEGRNTDRVLDDALLTRIKSK